MRGCTAWLGYEAAGVECGGSWGRQEGVGEGQAGTSFSGRWEEQGGQAPVILGVLSPIPCPLTHPEFPHKPQQL